MADKKTKTPTARKTRAVPKAATLFGYLNGYLKANDIGEDTSIQVVMNNLRDTIVEESQEV